MDGALRSRVQRLGSLLGVDKGAGAPSALLVMMPAVAEGAGGRALLAGLTAVTPLRRPKQRLCFASAAQLQLFVRVYVLISTPVLRPVPRERARGGRCPPRGPTPGPYTPTGVDWPTQHTVFMSA